MPDFGAGIGRVALPLYYETHVTTHACDITAAALGYLSRQLPGVECRTTSFDPPLPYASEKFDFVNSITVWTHLPEDVGLSWLKELRRVLKLGGIALISTSGMKVMSIRAERGDGGWKSLSIEGLEREGVLYKEYGAPDDPMRAYPGVLASFCLTAHDPEYSGCT